MPILKCDYFQYKYAIQLAIMDGRKDINLINLHFRVWIQRLNPFEGKNKGPNMNTQFFHHGCWKLFQLLLGDWFFFLTENLTWMDANSIQTSEHTWKKTKRKNSVNFVLACILTNQKIIDYFKRHCSKQDPPIPLIAWQ